MSRHTLCDCPAGFSAAPASHAPDCPGRSGAGKISLKTSNTCTPISATTVTCRVERAEVERLVKLLQYQAHPYPSPHAEHWQGVLDKPVAQYESKPAAWKYAPTVHKLTGQHSTYSSARVTCEGYEETPLHTAAQLETILQHLDNLAWLVAEGVLILKERNPEDAYWFAQAEAALDVIHQQGLTDNLPLENDAAVAAIQFTLEIDEGLAFLRCWTEGDFDAIREEWPEAPKEVFIGADPLHGKEHKA